MIQSTPPQPPEFQQLIAQTSSTEAPYVLQRSDIGAFVKKLILGYFVRQSIRDNEAQQITTGVEIIDLQHNETLLSHNADTQQFAASINKLPVTLLALKELRANRLQLDQTISWQASDVRAGAGVLDQAGAPLQATWKEVLYDLLNRSGNTAIRILVNKGLGGAAEVNNRLAQIPELSNTRLQPLDADRFYVGNSTPHESLWALQQLMKTNDIYTNLVKDALKANIYTDIGTRSQLAGNDYITLVNKVGLLNDVEGNNRHDVGIVYNSSNNTAYGYAFFTTAPFESSTATSQAEQSLQAMGRYVLRYSGDRKHSAASNAIGVLEAHQAENRIRY